MVVVTPRLPRRLAAGNLYLHEIDDPIYKVRVVRCVGPEAAFVAEVNRVHPQPPAIEVRGAAARSLVARTPEHFQRLWIWVSNIAADNYAPHQIAGLVAHEAVHGAAGAFEMIGLSTDRASEEALTYYVEWLTQTTLAYFWRE